MSDLLRATRDALATYGGVSGPLGYTCKAFRPAEGPLSDHVVKVLRGGRDPEVLEQLARRHQSYMDCLARSGLQVPETRFILLNQSGYLQPVILQRAMPEQSVLGEYLAAASLSEALSALDLSMQSIALFWRSVAQRPERIGLRVSAETIALHDSGLVHIGTFPPLIGYSRADIGRVLLRFSDSGLTRAVGMLLPERARARQDGWYSPQGNVLALVGAALRRRPGDRTEVLRGAAEAAEAHFDGVARAEVIAALERPARWAPVWLSTRRIAGRTGLSDG